MLRRSIAVLALLAFAGPAQAQSPSWVPWGDIGGGGLQAPARGSARAAADDDGSVFAPARSRPAPRSAVQFPRQMTGGARPSISPSAPPVVSFSGGYAAGSIVIDTRSRALYYVRGGGTAYRYPISVGRDGFAWRGTKRITRVQSWPDWRPPAEMRRRDPRLPEFMAGGLNNPLGAKALYLGSTLYRIHGTNDTRSIGYAASSGCFRMMNQHVMHLATLAGVGTTVHVLDRLPANVAVGPQRSASLN